MPWAPIAATMARKRDMETVSNVSRPAIRMRATINHDSERVEETVIHENAKVLSRNDCPVN